jgi:hypothetical protein
MPLQCNNLRLEGLNRRHKQVAGLETIAKGEQIR